MQKINFISPIVFEMLKLKNPAIWLAESIFALNSRTRFFADRQFQQNHKSSYDAWFEPKKSTHQWTIFLLNKKNPILGVFLDIIPKMRFFTKNPALSVFYPWGTLTSWEVSEKSYEPFWRKLIYLLTYWYNYIWQWWNHRTLFHLKVRVQK